MDANQVTDFLGSQRGKYHPILGVLLSFTLANLAVNHLAMIIYGYVPTHRCKQYGNVSPNATENATSIDYESCFVATHFGNRTLRAPCKTGWSFELEEQQSTIISEWSLVCGKQYSGMMAVTIYFCGVLFGGTFFGGLSDRFGRRMLIMVTMYAQMLIGIGIAFAPNYISFVVLRFLVGFLVEGLQATALVMLMEMMPTGSRDFFAGFYEQLWAIGSVWMAGVSWLLKDWRTIQLVFVLQNVHSIAYFWILPESIRWSVTKGRIEEAMKYVKKIARFNRMALPNDLKIKTVDMQPGVGSDEREKHSIRNFIQIIAKRKIIRNRALCMFHIWMTASFAYYGLSLNVSSLSGNIYKNLFISNLIEVPASIFAAVMFRCVGRRTPVIVYYLVAGVSCIIAGCLPAKTHNGVNLKPYILILAFIGKFFVSAAFGSLAIKTAELFPTSVRNTCLGACLFCTRIGAILAPQILLLSIYTFKELPFLIIGGISISASVSGWFLPETKGQPLADTVDDLESPLPQFTEEFELQKNVNREKTN